MALDDLLRNNPALMGIDQDKLNFILEFAQKEKPKNMKDAMPFLVANMGLAQKQNIAFSNVEVRLIADLLCKDLPEEEKAKVQKIMSMLGR
jgi:hypothetical protein